MAYCTQSDLEEVISAEGLTEWITDYLADGTTEVSAAVTSAIAEAGDKIEEKCFRYAIADLEGSDWVKRRAVRLALGYVCTRRGNKAPPSVQTLANEAAADLQAVFNGHTRIPRLTPQSENSAIVDVPLYRSDAVSYPIPDSENRVYSPARPTITTDKDEYTP